MHRKKTMFLYFHNETYVLINVSENITIFLWLNYNSESSLTVFVFQVSLPIDLKFLSNICYFLNIVTAVTNCIFLIKSRISKLYVPKLLSQIFHLWFF